MKSIVRAQGFKLSMFLFVLLMFPLLVPAQGFLTQSQPSNKIKIGLRFFHPYFDKDAIESISFFSGIYDASVSLPVGKNMNLVGSIPLMSLGAEGVTQKAWGNVYAGVVFKSHEQSTKQTSFAVGAYIPTVSYDKAFVHPIGELIDIMQFPRFLHSRLTINCNLAYHSTHSSGLLFEAEVGGWYTTFTKKENKPASYDNTEIYVHYGALLGYRAGSFDLTAEGVGAAHVTEKYETFRDRFVNELAFGAHLNLGQFRPGAFYKIYIEKTYREYIHGVLGFSLEILL